LLSVAALALGGRGDGEHRKGEETEREGNSACSHIEYFTRLAADSRQSLGEKAYRYNRAAMKQPQTQHRYFYVDETGDPGFYGKGKKLIVGTEGCSRIFGVGFLRTSDPDSIRHRLIELRAVLAADRYLAAIPSMQKTMRAFHAKDDCPEVRKAVFECLDGLDFSVQIVVARKLETVFKTKHQQSQDSFYNDLTSHLFERQLHLASENTIIFARRGDKAKQHALRASVEAGVAAFRRKYPNAISTIVDVETAYSADEPLLQAADYALWSVQRAFERGEMRYFEYLRSKIELVWDVYDFAALQAKRQVMYTRRNNPFHIEKASPLS
jgi:hypothetical protein